MGEQRAAALQAIHDFSDQTQSLVEQRRSTQFEMSQKLDHLDDRWCRAQTAYDELVKLMRLNPMLLLGNV